MILLFKSIELLVISNKSMVIIMCRSFSSPMIENAEAYAMGKISFEEYSRQVHDFARNYVKEHSEERRILGRLLQMARELAEY